MKLLDLFQPRTTTTTPPPQNVKNFLSALMVIAPPAGDGDYMFTKSEGGCHGFVQFIHNSPRSLTIHRLWTLERGQGNGSIMLRKLCQLADEHGVELTLKCLPFGRKPYPLLSEQLVDWYQRYGFVGNRKKMIREARFSVWSELPPPSPDGGL
jgi:hypothetical protein